jgi:hypothetical protein
VIEHLNGCDCPEARLLRVVLAGPLGVSVDALADVRAAEMLRSMSHELSAAMPARRGVAYADLARIRDTYERPPLSAGAIRAQTAASWDAFERAHGYR